jgi:hypothetical protein
LFAWLSSQNEERRTQSETVAEATELARKLSKWKINRAQWGELRAMARAERLVHNQRDAFFAMLEKHLTTGTRKLEKNWGLPLKGTTAGALLLELLKQSKAPAALLETLAELVVRQKKTARHEGDRA